jgi:maleylacetoacetate isomerase
MAGAATAAMRLHLDPRSSASRRVLAVLAYKGLDIEVVRVDLLAGEHHGAAHVALNPSRAVPVLELGTGEGVLSQSLAILELLEARFPEPPLLPSDPLLQARVRSLCALVAADVHPVVNLRIRREVERLAGVEAAAQWVRQWTDAGLAALDAWLARYAGRHAVGDALTLAEFFIVPMVANARRAGCEVAAHARVARVYEDCLRLPAFELFRDA